MCGAGTLETSVSIKNEIFRSWNTNCHLSWTSHRAAVRACENLQLCVSHKYRNDLYMAYTYLHMIYFTCVRIQHVRMVTTVYDNHLRHYTFDFEFFCFQDFLNLFRSLFDHYLFLSYVHTRMIFTPRRNNW